MKKRRKWLFLLWPVLLSTNLFAQSSVLLSVDSSQPGAQVPTDFIGLSYEMSLVDGAPDGGHYFSPTNTALISMFRTLGVKSLRVGGNTADRLTVKLPDHSDIDALFGFAEAAGLKVIYTLRVNQSEPSTAAATAKYIVSHYKPLLTAFAIGNEPNKLFPDYPAYRDTFREFVQAITASTNAPDALFCGTCATPKGAPWAKSFALDFDDDKRVVLVTQHHYPAGSGTNVRDSFAGCEKLLTANMTNVYQRFHDIFVPTVRRVHKQYRLEEANSFSNGGAASVSDAFASALWALDYLYWWASHGAEGINFHTGGASGSVSGGHMRYVAFWNAPDGFAAHPLAYGMKAFDVGAHGNLVPITVQSNAGNRNVTAYAVLSSDNVLHVTLINKEHDRKDSALVTLSCRIPIQNARAMFLTAPDNDITEKTDITLGGKPITHDGHWSGTWTPQPSTKDQVTIKLPAASAAIVEISLR